MRGAMPPLPQYVFMAWCLVKHRDNLPHVQTGSGVHPASYPVGTGVLSLGVKQPGRDVGNLVQSSNNVYSYTFTSAIGLYGVVLG
jgi:hypothetical protein